MCNIVMSGKTRCMTRWCIHIQYLQCKIAAERFAVFISHKPPIWKLVSGACRYKGSWLRAEIMTGCSNLTHTVFLWYGVSLSESNITFIVETFPFSDGAEIKNLSLQAFVQSCSTIFLTPFFLKACYHKFLSSETKSSHAPERF